MFKWIKNSSKKMPRGLAEKQEAVTRKIELAKKLMRLYGDRREVIIDLPPELERRSASNGLSHA